MPKSVGWVMLSANGWTRVALPRPASRERFLEHRRLELEVATRQADELCAGEELRCATLVDVDVGRLMAIDCAVGVGEGGQCDGVGAGAGGDRENLHRPLERGAETLHHASGKVVVAIGRGGAVAGGDERLEQFRCSAADIVAAKIEDGFRHRVNLEGVW